MAEIRNDNIIKHIETAFQGRYEYLNRLGSGGMGMVFLVRARDLSRKLFALKVVDKRSPENKGIDVYGEINILTEIKHPNIVNVYEAREDGNFVFIIQEYIEGKTLAEIRDNQILWSRLDEETVKLWMIDIADALSYLHSAGIVHRDIKPGNIIIDSDGMAKLIDFGIARRAETLKKSRKGNTVGSAPYSPLERLQGNTDGVQTDIYAYGATFYSLLRRRIPSVSGREINTLRSSNHSIEPYYMNAYRTMVGDIEYIQDEGMRELIRSCVDINPNRRVRDFNTIRYRLSSIDEERAEYTETRKRLRRSRIGLTALLIIGIILAGLGTVQMKRDHNKKYEKIIEDADSAYAAGDYNLSIEKGKEAVEFSPNNEAGYIIKYKAETTKAYEENNQDIYESLLEEIEIDGVDQPALQDNLYVCTYASNAYYETQQYNKAAEELQDRKDLEDDQLMLLGQALYNIGDNSSASECLGKMNAETPQKSYLQGLIKENSDYKAAYKAYSEVLEFENTEGNLGDLRRKAISQIARLCVENDEPEKAITAVNAAFEKDPALKDSPRLNSILLDCYYRVGDNNAVIKQAEEIIENFPSTVAYNRKSFAEAQLGMTEAALTTIDEWEKKYPEDPDAHIQKAIIYNNIAGAADTDSERKKAYSDYIRVYEEERQWLERHNAMSGSFEQLEESYWDAVNMLDQMEAGL